MKTRVINLTGGVPTDVVEYVYVGRGSYWGNPFKIGRDGYRDIVLRKYREYAMSKNFHVLAKTHLKGKVLGCFCHPLPCHADMLAEWADSE